MNIAFYCDAPDWFECARIALASVRRHMPTAHCVQLARPDTPACEVFDTVFRRPVEGDAVRRRMLLQAEWLDEMPGGTLFVDADCVFQATAEALDRNPAAIALPEIADPYVRYSNGVIYARDPVFFREAAELPEIAANPQADVRGLLTALQAHVDGWPEWAVDRLPWQQWEYLPRNAGDPCDGAVIVHYRGPRKRWMLERHAA